MCEHNPLQSDVLRSNVLHYYASWWQADQASLLWLNYEPIFTGQKVKFSDIEHTL